MSYSRWGTSRWYTFWSDSGKTNRANHQIFHICDLGPSLSFTYAQLKSDIDDCILQVKEHYEQEHTGQILSEWKKGTEDPPYADTTYGLNPATKAELQELKGYMMSFIEDVETDEEIVWD